VSTFYAADAGPPGGFSINWGTGTGFYSRNTTFNVTATAPGGAAVELETRVAQTKGGLGSNR
jgi:hypothetical protein